MKGTEPGSQNTRLKGKEIWVPALLINSTDGKKGIEQLHQVSITEITVEVFREVMLAWVGGRKL